MNKAIFIVIFCIHFVQYSVFTDEILQSAYTENIHMDTRHETRESVTLTSHNKKIFGILHKPINTERKVPAILLCHGFGGNKVGKFRLFVRLAERLTASGIAVFRFDARGAGDSEGEFRDTTIESLLEDAQAARNFLQNHTDIDTSRIAILGRSFGGVIAAQVATEFDCKALILWAPVFDAKPWVDALLSTKNVQTDVNIDEHKVSVEKKNQQILFMGEPLNSQFLKQFMNLNMHEVMKKLTECPMLHIQGAQDRSIVTYHIEQYKKVRDKIEKSTFIKYPISDHDFHDAEEQEQLLQETVIFCKTHLLAK